MASVPIRVDRDRRLHRNGSNLAPVAYGSAPGRLSQQQMDVRAALREGAYALTAHSRVRSELLQDGPCLHVGLRREAFLVEFACLGEVLPIHLVRPRVCASGDTFLLDHGVAVGGGAHVDDLHVVQVVLVYGVDLRRASQQCVRDQAVPILPVAAGVCGG